MKELLVFILTICIFRDVSGQNAGYYLNQYWNYRYALRGDDIDPSHSEWEPGFIEVDIKILSIFLKKSNYLCHPKFQDS